MAAALEREANTLERRLAMLNHPAGKNRSNNSGLDDILAAGPQIPNNVLDMFQASDTIGEPPVEKRDSDE